ncbi:MAG TPA: DUF1360 domain-containing protein [Chondromyces sp.]|nr:DUF1360 domain-containing protein [Chondromyces sp.]
MELSIYQFIVMCLASFRITRLLVFDKITEFIRAPFFEEIEELDEDGKKEIYIVPKSNGIKGWIGQLLSCYWCTGIWVAIGCYILSWQIPQFAAPLLTIFAIAGAAAIIESIVQVFLSRSD